MIPFHHGSDIQQFLKVSFTPSCYFCFPFSQADADLTGGRRGRHTERGGFLPWAAEFLILTIENPFHLFGCSCLSNSAKSPDRLWGVVLMQTPPPWPISSCKPFSLPPQPSQSHSVVLSVSIYQVVQTSHVTSWYRWALPPQSSKMLACRLDECNRWCLIWASWRAQESGGVEGGELSPSNWHMIDC